ncbi:helix-turn-helix transcriptional regulator [Sphingomonas sp. PB1R3]|uniref:helix-turn-helix transcriptional regulator n=1 Tax=Sphingomonas flavida TaxID=3096154 RepID=UPI002FC66CC7
MSHPYRPWPSHDDPIPAIRNVFSSPQLLPFVQHATFPKNVQLSTRCVGWRASAIEEWLRNPMFYHVDDHPAR